jgi:hypothetical protein
MQVVICMHGNSVCVTHHLCNIQPSVQDNIPCFTVAMHCTLKTVNYTNKVHKSVGQYVPS